MRTNHPAFSPPRAARLTPLAAAFAMALSPAAFGVSLVVNTTAPTGPGSLGQAILDANAACGSSPVISFALTGTGPFVIQPSAQLPTAFCGAIDGYSQAGATANSAAAGFNAALKVTLDGSSQSYGCGLTTSNAGYGPIVVKGLTIQDFDSGVCGRADLFGNVIRNNNYGADLYGYGFTIGGSAPADRNVFTGNTSAGIYISGGGAYVENNFIGTANGSTAAANGKGIYIANNGGTITDNVISGNSDVGVYVDNDYGGTAIFGNRIGLNAAKSGKIANGGGGVYINGGGSLDIIGNLIAGNGVFGIGFIYSYDLNISNNVIGLSYGGSPLPNTRGIDAYCSGYVSIAGNVIAANQFEGVLLDGTSGASLVGNTIGDNGTSGVRIDIGSCYGGDNFLGDNLVTGNKQDGVLITGASTGNTIYANSIHANVRKNINLNNNPTTLPNDSTDADGGSNNQQNYPALDEAVTDAGDDVTYISYSLDSINNTSFRVDFYANDAAGGPAGKTFIGMDDMVFVYGGVYFGTFQANGVHNHISATATNLSTGDTSEFSPQVASIAAPAATVTPSTVNFGDVLVNTESAPRTITIRSVGDIPYEIESIDESGFCYGGSQDVMGVASAAPALCYGGAFICETTCTPTPYAKNQSCRITARFAPTFTGTYSTNLYICDNTTSSPKSILLTGQAVLPPPIVVTPRAWDFGSIPIGEAGEPKRFVVSNIGYGGLNLESLATTGEFDVLNSTCGSFLYGGSSCDAVVNFLPTQTGEATGSFVATYSSFVYGGTIDSGPVIGPTLYKAGATLTGIGIGGGSLVLPGPVELGAATVGGGPISRSVELRNNGTQPVNISSITLSGPFTLVNNCPASLAAGASCSLVISFSATVAGDANGSLTVVSDAAGGSGEIGVHATGQVVAAPLLQISPSSIGFGDRVIGSQSSAQTVTITNVGGVAATLSLTTTSIDFLIAGNSCGTSLAPQATCSALVAFRPLLGFGQRLGSLVVTSNASNSPQGVALSGTGCRPYVGAGNRIGSSSNCAP